MTSSVDDYEVWGSYYLHTSQSLRISSIASSTISEISTLLGGWLGVAASILVDVATVVFNNQYGNLYDKIYRSVNAYCPILQKERIKFYSNSSYTNYLKQKTFDPKWYGSPKDFSQPAACRILERRY